MFSYRPIVLAAAVALGVAGVGSTARAADPGCTGPFCNTPRYPTLSSYLFRNIGNKQPQPTFQAAPWYLYWPYDGHFQTPAPINAPIATPPVGGNFPVNPYFPAPAGYAGFGPIPGGPAPAGMPYAPGGFGPAPAPYPTTMPPVGVPRP
jgi:hypothetical protein